jgi:hypothetical protein
MNFIKRWLEKRRKAVEILVMDVAPRDLPAEDSRTHRRSIVRRVKFSSWPDELEHKPYFIRAFEVNSALSRLVKRGKLKQSQYHYVSPEKSISTDTFMLHA